MAVAVAGLNLFAYCYFGEIASKSYAKMADCLFESHWYEHPVDLQKYFIPMIQNTQYPIYYHGFGIANLDLDNFTDVSHGYLMVNHSD